MAAGDPIIFGYNDPVQASGFTSQRHTSAPVLPDPQTAIAGLPATYALRAPDWVTGRAYVVGELVTSSGSLYRCATAHTSAGSFDGSKFTAISGGGGGAVSSVVGQTGAVTGSQILADTTVAAALTAKAASDLSNVTASTGRAALGLTIPVLVRSVSVSYAAAVTPNADTTDVLVVGTLTGNITLANPSGTPLDGQTLRMRLTQDATGSRTITWGAAYAFGTDVTTGLIPTAASSKWEQVFEWCAADSKWRAVSIIRGF